MKLTSKILLCVFALAQGAAAFAQTNAGADDTDYAKFSQFIADRNIFDPNRYPHSSHSTYRPHTQHHSNSAPAFTLVGVMTYEKGLFAFFSGNNDDLKKILTVSGGIAGYTVTKITMDEVSLVGADKKELTLKIGDQMRHENNGWQLVEQGDAPAGSGIGVTAAATGGGSTTSTPTDSAAAAPAPNLGNNDVLKRLMENRNKE